MAANSPFPQRLEQQLESNDPKGAPQVGFSNS